MYKIHKVFVLSINTWVCMSVYVFDTHQHYNVFHVVVLLGVKEGCELLLVGFHVIVLVSHFESPLITIHHLPVAKAIIRVGVVCKSEVTTLFRV